jgi:hypothetical protein
MFSADQQTHDDQVLVRYLLGLLPDEETVRLDELSITDGEFAWRLKAAENDLVDSYVSGDLSGETLERFQSVYLSSGAHREKVGFAESLLVAGKRGTAVTQVRAKAAPWRWLIFPPRALAACALVLLLVAGFLVWEDIGLRRRLAQTEIERSNLAQEVRSLQSRVEAPVPATNAAPAERLASFVLLAQARGVGPLPVISLPSGTSRVELQLELEVDEFPFYQVAFKDLAANRIVSRSSGLKAQRRGANRIVSFDIQPSLLGEQNYMVELSGVPAGGAPEFVAGYAFRVASVSKP